METMQLIKSALQQMIDNIDAGNSNASEDELTELLEVINRVTNTKSRLSKYQACKYLNVSRATFDNWVKDGKIPAGKKEAGFKEKFLRPNNSQSNFNRNNAFDINYSDYICSLKLFWM